MQQLYIQNKGFIFNVIRKYRYACISDYGGLPIIEMDELMHKAYFSLVKAAETYNLDQGALFLTYAAYWIIQSVKHFFENSGQVIRVPVHRQQEIYKYSQASSCYLSHCNRLPSIQEYAWHVGISVNRIEHLEKFMFQTVV
jgi:RNA polymerase primary sigma factor